LPLVGKNTVKSNDDSDKPVNSPALTYIPPEPPPLRSEVARHMVANGKSPGPDGIAAKLLNG